MVVGANNDFDVWEWNQYAREPGLQAPEITNCSKQNEAKQVKPGFTTYQPRRQLNFKVTGTLLLEQVT